MDNRIHALIDSLSDDNPFHDGEVVPHVDKVKWNPAMLTSKAFLGRTVAAKVAALQRIVCQLEYNFLPTVFHSLQKRRPLKMILSSAKEMLTESLPIRCLEACFLSVFLTQGLTDLERVPLSFDSVGAGGELFHHIVLAIGHRSVAAPKAFDHPPASPATASAASSPSGVPIAAWGAMGLSRRPSLMDKPLTFPTLAALLDDYSSSYAQVGHTLTVVRIGLPISHQTATTAGVVPCWRYLKIRLPNRRPGESAAASGGAKSRRRTAAATDVGRDAPLLDDDDPLVDVVAQPTSHSHSDGVASADATTGLTKPSRLHRKLEAGRRHHRSMPTVVPIAESEEVSFVMATYESMLAVLADAYYLEAVRSAVPPLPAIGGGGKPPSSLPPSPPGGFLAQQLASSSVSRQAVQQASSASPPGLPPEWPIWMAGPPTAHLYAAAASVTGGTTAVRGRDTGTLAPAVQPPRSVSAPAVVARPPPSPDAAHDPPRAPTSSTADESETPEEAAAFQYRYDCLLDGTNPFLAHVHWLAATTAASRQGPHRCRGTSNRRRPSSLMPGPRESTVDT